MRDDGRNDNESRSVTAVVGGIIEADGSAELSHRHSKYVATVIGPTLARYSRLDNFKQALIDVSVEMCGENIDNNSNKLMIGECEAFVRHVAYNCVDISLFPRTVISVKILVTGCDGSLLSSSANVCMLAMLDCGLSMKADIPWSVTICHFTSQDDITFLVDPTLNEEMNNCGVFVFSLSSSEDNSVSTTVSLLCESQFSSSSYIHASVLAELACESLNLKMRCLLLTKLE